MRGISHDRDGNMLMFLFIVNDTITKTDLLYGSSRPVEP
jgi:hypothetical protein